MSSRSALQTLRKLRGHSQGSLAVKSGISQSRISEAESGARPLSTDAAIKLGAALKSDPVALYLDSAIRSVEAGVRDGSQAPQKVSQIARTLVSLIESGELDADQLTIARNAVSRLVDLVEDAAQKQQPGTLSSLLRRSDGQRYPLDPPMREDLEDEAQRAPFSTAPSQQESAETYAELGRDSLGRAKPGDDVVDLDMDSLPESGTPASRLRRRKKKLEEAAIKSDELMGDDLGRDSFGRQLNN